MVDFLLNPININASLSEKSATDPYLVTILKHCVMFYSTYCIY